MVAQYTSVVLHTLLHCGLLETLEALAVSAERSLAVRAAWLLRALLAMAAADHLIPSETRLRLQQPADAVRICTQVLARDPAAGSRVKALFRRACGSIELREFVAAQQDLVAAAKLEPARLALLRGRVSAAEQVAERGVCLGEGEQVLRSDAPRTHR